jgi:dephospho-CoA kinase
MKKIGLTGGIGSGKTYVAQILEKMGYPVYYSDTRAKKLCNEDPLIIRQLKELLGDDAYKNEKLNKSFISNQIFSSPDLRESINSIIHPVVRNDFDQWLENLSSHSLVFNEAAILFETKSYKRFDEIILVYAPLEIKIQRLISRDRVSKEEITAKMNAQWSDAKKMTLTRFHILNDEKTPLLEQIETILEKLN